MNPRDLSLSPRQARLLSSAVFALLFILVGLAIPYVYAAVGPVGEFITVSDTDAETTVVDEEAQIMASFSFTAEDNYRFNAKTYLYPADGDDPFGEPHYWGGVLPKGHHDDEAVVLPLLGRTPAPPPGDYYLVHEITIEVKPGIWRQTRVTSPTFNVTAANLGEPTNSTTNQTATVTATETDS